MNRVYKWLEHAKGRLEKDYDLIVPVVGDEGSGKSTFMLECGWLWLDVLGDREQTVDNAMGQIAWNLDEFKDHISSRPQYSLIMVHDAARVLSRKKAMHGEQIEVEEDLLDMRFGNYIVLLGFQEFDLIPTMLATRRSKNLMRIPKRGVVHGHNEKGVRSRYDNGSWPDPVMRDSFPSLEGKSLWDAFVEEDQERKQARISPGDEEADMSISEWAERVVEDGVKDVVSIHGTTHEPYIDAALIEAKYELSGNKSRKVAKLLKKRMHDGEFDDGGATA